MNWRDCFDPNKVFTEQVAAIVNPSGLSSSKFSANPYIGCPHRCLYCYVPCMKNGPSYKDERWGTYLGVKYWTPLSWAELMKFAGAHVTIGSSTDPYNPLEPHFRRTRTLLEELAGSDVHISIITKSNLVLNDLNLLTCFDNVRVCISINTLDEKFKDEMDAAPPIASRIDTLEKCKDLGLNTACFISPVFPLLTDVIAIIERVRLHCDSIWIDGLNLQSGNLGKVTGHISMEYPWAFPLYRKMFRDKDTSFWLEESTKIREYAKKCGMQYTTDKMDMSRGPLGRPIIVDFLPRRARRL